MGLRHGLGVSVDNLAILPRSIARANAQQWPKMGSLMQRRQKRRALHARSRTIERRPAAPTGERGLL
ncbi:hypothetical protein C4K23_5812 [Pseudomonas chlororaphis]|nr:hypothetical protein C4K23_5812 [Pseudomonas chlororaphis]